MAAAVTDLHIYGWNKELDLWPLLETELCCKLEKTEARFDAVDFENDKYVVEIKARRSLGPRGRPVTSATYSTWLLPACKGEAVEKSGKRGVFFYFFEGDRTVWRLDYDAERFAKYEQKVPPAHPTGQMHYYIPADEWRLVYEPEKPAVGPTGPVYEVNEIIGSPNGTTINLALI